MTLPQALLDALEGVKGYNRETFIAVHNSGEQVTPYPLFNPLRTGHQPSVPLDASSPIPWTSHGFYLSARPSFTFDPAFHGGLYYVQEASSMFLEQALKQTTDLTQNITGIDLCAAPGGKSTLIQSLISPDSLLASNDAIKSRAAILEENLTKWGAANAIVTNNDPAHFARLENFFEVLVIDAPCGAVACSGAMKPPFQNGASRMYSFVLQRQQRILADSWVAIERGRRIDLFYLFLFQRRGREYDGLVIAGVRGRKPSSCN